MTPPSGDLLTQAEWLVAAFPASTDMTTMVLQTGWRRKKINMLLRLLALSPEIHSLVRRGVLDDKQVMRLTNVVRSVHRERILREML